MRSLVILACVIFAVIGLYILYTMPAKENFTSNPTDPLSASSPSGSIGAAGAPDVSTPPALLAGASSATSSPINAPPTNPVPFIGWTPNEVPARGTLPTATQTSAISGTVPNTSVPDPSMSIAQNTDIQSTLDAIDAFNNVVANTNTALMTDAAQQQLRETSSSIATMKPAIIAAYTNPDATMLTVSDLSALRGRITAMTNVLKQLPANEGGTPATPTATPTPVTVPTDQITLDALKNLVTRINAASLVLANLQTTDATLVQRKSKLDQMSADLQDMISRVTTGSLALADVPIKPADAMTFLNNLDNKASPLPLLVTPTTPSSTPGNYTTTNSMNASTQDLLQSFQKVMAHVKFQFTYDPKSAQRAEVMERLQKLEDKLFAYAGSETPLPSSIYALLQQEIRVLGSIATGTEGDSDYSPTNSLPTTYTRFDSGDTGSSPSYPNVQQMNAATGSDGLFLNPATFPGLSDEQIARRGSSATFDESTVGGLDYKVRAVEMCRQLKSVYGDTKTFGCITDPESVSADYSWRGNYMSVCNRVGDIWGSDEGEKYGCPPYDPAAKFRQT